MKNLRDWSATSYRWEENLLVQTFYPSELLEMLMVTIIRNKTDGDIMIMNYLGLD